MSTSCMYFRYPVCKVYNKFQLMCLMSTYIISCSFHWQVDVSRQLSLKLKTSCDNIHHVMDHGAQFDDRMISHILHLVHLNPKFSIHVSNITTQIISYEVDLICLQKSQYRCVCIHVHACLYSFPMWSFFTVHIIL